MIGSPKLRTEYWAYVHRTQEGEGAHRIHQEDPSPWAVHSRVVVGQDVGGRNRNLQEGGRCRIHRQP